MRYRFTVIEGGALSTDAVVEVVAEETPVAWRVDLRRAASIGAGEIAAWRALLARAGVADPVRADPDYLLSAAQHQAGGRDLIFALAWAVGNGPDRLGAVIPLAMPHTLFGHGRIVVWQPYGSALAPTFAPGSVEPVRAALVTALQAIRPRATLELDTPVAPAIPEAEPASRLRTVTARGTIPAHSLVGVRPVHAPEFAHVEPARIERVRDPNQVRDAVEAFLLLDAEASSAPIIGDPSEAAMVRVVTRLFARRNQVTVTLTRRADKVVAATITLGAGASALVWRQADAAPERLERSA